MGGKHYYCDYCDRTFKEGAGVRKKHLSSLQHIKNRDEHYNQFKDPAQILEEEKGKNVCMRFMKNGECQFGVVCRYSHYTPAMIQYLQSMVAAKTKKDEKVYNPDPEQIMKEFFQDAIDLEDAVETDVNPWPLPSELKNYNNLPPSLWPITYKNFRCKPELPDWGWRYK